MVPEDPGGLGSANCREDDLGRAGLPRVLGSGNYPVDDFTGHIS